MDSTTYSTEDFLADESFQDYVREANPAAVQFWQRWLRQNPAQASIASEAAALLIALTPSPRPYPTVAVKEAEAAKLWDAIGLSQKLT